MNATTFADLLELPVAERVRLVQAIWDSIAEVPDALELSASQRAELNRRLDAYKLDPTAGSPWPDVKARILNGA